MSIREEEERRKTCTNRGLGLAAAAIGVGVGAALYYLFTKREEQPSAAGSTSGTWTCDAPPALDTSDILKNLTMESVIDSDSEYSTISEHSTTDTSVIDVSENVSEDVSDEVGEDVSDESCMMIDVIEESDADMENEDSLSVSSFLTDDSLIIDDIRTISDFVAITSGSEYDPSEWEVTTNSLDIPRNTFQSQSPVFNVLRSVQELFSPSGDGRRQVTRSRTWSLEECSICCDIMLKDQELTSLPCTHRFHKGCIQPWLQMDDQHTCPNCRKQAA